MKIETVKGFRDFEGEEALKRREIKRILEEIFNLYGFEPAETPIVEYEEFVRGENQNDEAISDIFKLEDRGKRKLALRYEFTFQLKRLMNNKKLPYKRYTVGPVFRDEPVKENRLRQFTQCDVDVVGSTIKNESEILDIVKNVLNKLNLKAEIFVNNRKLLNEIIGSYGVEENNFANVIREIDKMDKISEREIKDNLKKYGAEKIFGIFKKPEKYFEKFSSYGEIKELKKSCMAYGIKVKFSPSLARGLSYYNGNVFEVKAKGIKETIFGGGSYMFNGIQCTGISAGLERICAVANIFPENNLIMVVSLNQDKEAIKLANELRAVGKKVLVYYGKPSKSLDYANSYNFKKVLFVGEDEVKSGKFTLKDLESGVEKKVSLKNLLK